MTYIHLVLWGHGIGLVRKTNSKNMECTEILLKQKNFLELGMSLRFPHMRTSESSEESSANKSPSGDGLPEGKGLERDQETPFFTSLSSGKTQSFSAVPDAGAAEAKSPHSSLPPFRMYLSSWGLLSWTSAVTTLTAALGVQEPMIESRSMFMSSWASAGPSPGSSQLSGNCVLM